MSRVTDSLRYLSLYAEIILSKAMNTTSAFLKE